MADDFPLYKTRQDLEQLIADGATEGTTLEFKDSRALTRDEGKITELCVNVSALANSAGGQIIYGINENKKTNGPVVVDEGVTDRNITREWIGQILNSRIQPRLAQYSIDAIDLHNGQLGFVISVPQSLTGPHQAPDNKYYRRFALEVRAMEDYEIRDVMRRATTPHLYVAFSFNPGERTHLDFGANQEYSHPVALMGKLGNKSPQPAFHAVIRIGISASLRLARRSAPWVHAGADETTDHGKIDWMYQRLSVPPAFPVFRELEQPLDQIGFPLLFHERTLAQSHRWPIIVEILSPGFASTEVWFIHQHGSQLRLLPPGHPLLR